MISVQKSSFNCRALLPRNGGHSTNTLAESRTCIQLTLAVRGQTARGLSIRGWLPCVLGMDSICSPTCILSSVSSQSQEYTIRSYFLRTFGHSHHLRGTTDWMQTVTRIPWYSWPPTLLSWNNSVCVEYSISLLPNRFNP